MYIWGMVCLLSCSSSIVFITFTDSQSQIQRGKYSTLTLCCTLVKEKDLTKVQRIPKIPEAGVKMECCPWKFIRKHFVGSMCQFWRCVCKLNDAPCKSPRASKVHVPATSPSCRRESSWSWFRLKWRSQYDCRQKSSKLEILNAGCILSSVRRRLGAASTVRELGEAVRLAARVVRLRHQQNWMEVQRLPGPGYRLRIADETTIHLTCNHTHQRSTMSG